jgi:flagellar basal-body rod protein FlgG
MFQAKEMLPQTEDNPGLKQGFLETSNINPVNEMVQMIEALRSFESYQKSIQILDGINDVASNRLGRIA